MLLKSIFELIIAIFMVLVFSLIAGLVVCVVVDTYDYVRELLDGHRKSSQKN